MIPDNLSWSDTQWGWVQVVLGEQNVSTAKTLPPELIRSLYGQVLTYGPAGEEISFLVEEIRESLQDNETKDWFVERLIFISDSVDDIYNFLNTIEPIPKRFSTLAGSLQFLMNHSFMELVHSGVTTWKGSEMILGAKCLAWALNSQYLFFEELMPNLDPEHVKAMNEVLRVLGCEPLKKLGSQSILA